MKFEGPRFFPGETGDKSYVHLDRVILVEPDSNTKESTEK
jgi:hypothetical protein